MKITLTLLTMLLLTIGCKKLKEQAQENIVLQAMTDGQWRMTKFMRDSTDKTVDFAPYRFQFHRDNTVDAINNGRTEKTGTWAADPNARTISSTFSNATTPLSLLNGTWKITNNSWTFVEATQTVNNEVLTIRIDK